MFRALSRVGGAAARRSASGSSLSIAADVSGSSLSVAAGVDTRLAPSAFHAGLVAGRLGASASLAGTGAARFASSNSLARTVAARLGSSPSPAAAGPARLGPSSAFARGISTNNPPPGLSPSELALYQEIMQLEAHHTDIMNKILNRYADLNKRVSMSTALFGKGAAAFKAEQGHIIAANIITMVMFVSSGLLLAYGMMCREGSTAAKASAQENAAAAMAAEKMEKAAIAAEKAAVAMAMAGEGIAALSAGKATSAEEPGSTTSD
ncbi:unnamed protein product [Urochloa humidicola]